jgi:hypothetical protein
VVEVEAEPVVTVNLTLIPLQEDYLYPHKHIQLLLVEEAEHNRLLQLKVILDQIQFFLLLLLQVAEVVEKAQVHIMGLVLMVVLAEAEVEQTLLLLVALQVVQVILLL